MRKTITTTISLFYLSSLTLLGQLATTKQDSLRIKEQVNTLRSIELPISTINILPPDMVLLNQYGDYPVDLSNGLVNISIPIYEVKINSLSLPISLSFHASGLRADEREGVLGLRWLLNAGGQVTRIIKGYPDEEHPFLQNINNASFQPDFIALYGTTYPSGQYPHNSAFLGDLAFLAPDYKGVKGEYRDTEYDIFSYSLPTGRSGKFILKDINGVKTPCLMPYEPMRVRMLYDIKESKWYTGMEITDENGIVYRFGKAQTSLDQYGKLRSYIEGDEDGRSVGWHLTSITSSDKIDTIEFEYIQPRKRSGSQWIEQVEIYDNLHDNSFYSSMIYYDSNGHEIPNTSPIYDAIGEKLSYEYLKDDQYFNQSSFNPYVLKKIKFKYGTIDFNHGNGGINDQYLSKIEIKDINMEVIKAVSFDITKKEQEIFHSLKSLKIAGSSNQTQTNDMVYKFDYYDSNHISNTIQYSDLPKYADWWGYFNSDISRHIMDEDVYIAKPDPIGGAGDSKQRHIGHGSNRNSNEQDMKIGMIKSIEYPTGGISQFDYKSNSYELSGPSSLIKRKDCGGLRIKEVRSISEKGKVERKRYQYGNNDSGIMPLYLYPPDQGNFYKESKNEYYIANEEFAMDGGHPGLFNVGYGKYTTRTYMTNLPSHYFDFHSNIVYYNLVTEYIGDENQNSGRIEYEYDIRTLKDEGYNFSSNNYTYNPTHVYVNPTNFWEGNKLSSKITYKEGQITPIKKNIYDYTSFIKESVFDIPVFRYRNLFIQMHTAWGVDQQTKREKFEIEKIWNESNDIFGYKNQEYTIGAEKLTKETEYTYNGNGTIISEKEFSYDPKYLILNEEKSINSNGLKQSVRYKYPFDYPSVSILSSMVSLNILSPIIEKSIYIDNSFLEKGITNYNFWHSTFYSPLNFQYQQKNEALTTRIEYNYGTGKNLQEIIKDKAKKTVYLWSYSGQYPIAKIDNTPYQDVENILTPLFINTLAEQETPPQNMLEEINTLRAKLPNALVTTYTYKSLVGMTSATDPRGVTTYYDYDTFGRLKETYIIENGMKKIIQVNDYHYQK